VTGYTLERSTVIPAPLGEVFAFFEDPGNLARITPRGMGFDITHIDELPIKPGFRIDYTIRIMRVPVRWTTIIPVYDPPHRFVDIQAKGPYRSWTHEHTFEDQGGQTLMRDRVQYELPFGILGRAAHALVVSRQLRDIFDYRARKIRRIFGKAHAPTSA
jgi:ligand-binding SRPBCC domain-containing protein